MGGAETLCLRIAQRMSAYWRTEILTTCALDYLSWDNYYPAGEEECQGTVIRRFRVDAPRDIDTFNRLSEQLYPHRTEASTEEQEAWMQAQGPISSDLRAYVSDYAAAYDAFIFFGYYATTYYLLPLVEDKAYLAPFAHDEWTFDLPVWERLFARPCGFIFSTPEEQQFLRACYPGLRLEGPIVGVAVDPPSSYDGQRFRQQYQIDTPFLLYLGRIDLAKGCAELFDYFLQLRQRDSAPRKLVLLGKPSMPVPVHPDIVSLGFVDEQTKWDALAACDCLIMPSLYESLSIVLLEAWTAERPVLVNAGCLVLVGQCRRAQGGLWYENAEEFCVALEQLRGSTGDQLGRKGRRFVDQTYTWPVIEQQYLDVLDGRVCFPSVHTETPQIALRNRPPLLLPANWSEEALLNFVLSICVEDAPPEEMQNYARADFKRFVYTLGLVPKDKQLTLLELGANPYFTTTLLRTFRNVDLHLANFFDGSEPHGKQQVTIGQTGEVILYEFDQFNPEEDRFPYADASFDVVLFCEILEHLLIDPVHALLEIRRILKPDGLLVLTTPNVSRLENVCRMVVGENLYDRYSGYGPYGRHNREYNRHDLARVLTANGFLPETLFTADVHPDAAQGAAFLEQLNPLLAHRQADLGQYIFSCSRLTLNATLLAPVRPDWLYRSLAPVTEET